MPPKRNKPLFPIKKEIKEEIEEETPPSTEEDSESDNDAGSNAPKLRRSARLQEKTIKEEASDIASPRPKRTRKEPKTSARSATIVRNETPSHGSTRKPRTRITKQPSPAPQGQLVVAAAVPPFTGNNSNQSDNVTGTNAPTNSTQSFELRRSLRLRNKKIKEEVPVVYSPRPKRARKQSKKEPSKLDNRQRSLRKLSRVASRVEHKNEDVIVIYDSDDDDITLLPTRGFQKPSKLSHGTLLKRYRAPRKMGWILPTPLSPTRSANRNDAQSESDDDDDITVVSDVFSKKFPRPPRRDDDDDEAGPSASQLVS